MWPDLMSSLGTVSVPVPVHVVPSPSRNKRRWFALGGIFLVLLLILPTSLYLRAIHALPQVDGEIGASGISAPIEVLRDAQGVPHIRAQNMQDLLFAQGYVTAQDRLWQMDITRRYAAGELAEVLGPGLLAHDRRFPPA